MRAWPFSDEYPHLPLYALFYFADCQVFGIFNFIMKHVSILVPEGECSITTIEGTYQILLRVNDWLVEAGEEPMFQVQLVGQGAEVRMKEGRFPICPDV